VKFAALGNLDGRTQYSQHLIGKLFSGVPAIGQYALDRLQIFFTPLKGRLSTLSIIHLRGRDRHRMRKPLRVHRQMPFDPRHLLARVVALAACGIAVFNALRIDDEKTGRGVPLQFHAGRANLIFLTPAPAGSSLLHPPHAIS
jgi:hypothetical protein